MRTPDAATREVAMAAGSECVKERERVRGGRQLGEEDYWMRSEILRVCGGCGEKRQDEKEIGDLGFSHL